jgi:hypothetical protein
VFAFPRQRKVTNWCFGSFSASSTSGVPEAATSFQNASVFISPPAICVRSAAIFELTYFSGGAMDFSRSWSGRISSRRSSYRTGSVAVVLSSRR